MKHNIITIIFCIFFMGMSLMNVCKENRDVSIFERRKLAQVPVWDFHEFMDGDSMKQFDNYASDQMIFREQFQSIKANLEFTFFQKKDVHGFYEKNGAIYSRQKELNRESVAYITSKIQEQAKKFKQQNKIYYSIIPDKNYYLKDEFAFLDTAQLVNLYHDYLGDYTYLDIFPLLDTEDFYTTDPHWKQEQIEDVAQMFITSFGSSYQNIDKEWKEMKHFYGSYYGRLGMDLMADTLRYFHNPIFANVRVFDVEQEAYIAIYDESKLYGYDPYEIYLSGAKPILRIENPNVHEQKELVIYRDSFASPLVPYLIPAYSLITLIDLRYVQSDVVDTFVTYENQDVLFLYSTSLVNQSGSIK